MPGPYLRLQHTYDEPLGRGWGIDLPGRPGPNLKFKAIQAHTLATNEDDHSDMHVIFMKEKILFLGAGAGRCLEARSVKPRSLFDAKRCRNSALQRWEVKAGELRLKDSRLCLTVGQQDTQGRAGPIMFRRDLLLEKCQRNDAQLWCPVIYG